MAKLVSLVSIWAALLLAVATNGFMMPQPAFTRPTTDLSVRIKVDVGDGEPVESAIRRFKREVNAAGHLMELRHKRYFENSQEKKKRKIKEGRLRKKFERMQRKRMAQRT